MSIHAAAPGVNLSPAFQQGDDRSSVDEITLDQLADLALRGRLRLRAFGEVSFYGFGPPFHGNLVAAAQDVKRLALTGAIAFYRDEDGIFIGPSNPKCVGEADARRQETWGRA